MKDMDKIGLWAENKLLRAEVARLKMTVSFFASVIKSGERWSEQCQQHLDAALVEGKE